MEWTIRGLLPRGGKMAFYGEDGVGKSIMSLQIAIALSRGETFFETFVIPEPHKVYYLSGEGGHNELRGRLQDLEAGGLVIPKDMLSFGVDMGLCLDDDTGYDILASELEDKFLSDDGLPYCLIIDNIGTFSDADETRLHETTKFRRRIDRLITEYGVSVILVHHATKPQYNGGSKVYRGSVDMRGAGWSKWLDGVVRAWGDAGTTSTELRFEKVRSDARPRPVGVTFDPDYSRFQVTAVALEVLILRAVTEHGPIPQPDLREITGSEDKELERVVRRMERDRVISRRPCTREEWPKSGHRANMVLPITH
jgi:RecA-family ATPase